MKPTGKKTTLFVLAGAIVVCALIFFYIFSNDDEIKTIRREKKNHENNMLTYKALQKELSAQNDAVEKYVHSLSEEVAISQLFLVNIDGSERFAPVEYQKQLYTGKNKQNFTDKSNLKERPLIPGGYLFFSYNIASSFTQVISFTDSIASYCEDKNTVRPYLAIDQEGGSVNRLRGITSTLPSNKRVSALFTSKEAYELYSAQAAQLHALGFTMNIAPVSEVCMASNVSFISDRSYGDEEAVVSFCTSAIRAYEKNKVGTVVKHFPGNTNSDPHSGLPEITLSAADLQTLCITPFARVLSVSPDAVLMSHARTEAHDEKTPACLSSFWVTDMLRKKMGYTGLVISDDIFMAALEKNGFPPETATVKAIEAGVDVIMLSDKRFASTARILLEKAAHDPVFQAKVHEAEKQVVWFKIKCGIFCIKRNGGGQYEVSEQSTDAQFGTNEQRVAQFQEQYNKGTDVYTFCAGRYEKNDLRFLIEPEANHE